MNMTPRPAEPAYAISQWPDNRDLMDRLNALLKQPLRGIRKDAMPGILDYFEQKCQTSKTWAKRAEEVIPGGVQHNLAFNYPFPIAAAYGAGIAEIVLPILLVLGLLTRFAALALLVMTAVIQLTVPEGWANFHLPWAAMALTLVVLGGGKVSLDALLRRTT